MPSVLRGAVVLLLLGAGMARAMGDVDDLSVSPARGELAAERLRLTTEQRKLDTRLRSLVWPGRRAARRSALVPWSALPAAGPVRVYVRVSATSADVLQALRSTGARVERVDRAGGTVEATMEPPQMRALAARPWLVTIRPAESGRLRTGSVTSEGDAASRANLVRPQGYDGTGVAVGVISDGIDHAASAQATGDLPVVTVPPGCTARNQDDPNPEDEGTALLEIVHDLAPGAPLLFASGLASSLAFIDAVHCLLAGGARVIVDDLGFFEEPFFADGPVAAAVLAAVQADVSYHSAAGNEAQEHMEQQYRDSGNNDFHDFGGGDQADDVQVAAGGTVTCILQWNDPFGASANDYDLGIFDASLQHLLSASTNPQNGTQDPIEIAGVVNTTGATETVKVAIQKVHGAARLLDMFCLENFPIPGGQQYVIPAESIIGHPALPEVVAVGAINVHDPGLANVEAFSSRGPARVFFPAAATRPKPDLVAYDGVSITNAGDFPPGCPPSCAFFGTSAAAPHSAAVAALLLHKNTFLTPAAIQGALKGGAVDIGPPGFDETAGAGRLDALAAAAAVPVPECYTSTACDDANVCTVDGCDRGTCTHTPIACADDDPCTVDDCDPVSGCRHTELPGVDYVSCALEQRLRPLLPTPSGPAAGTARKLLAALARAEHLVGRANAGPAGRRRRLLARATRILAAMKRLATRHTTALGSTVVKPIDLEASAIGDRIRTLQQSL